MMPNKVHKKYYIIIFEKDLKNKHKLDRQYLDKAFGKILPLDTALSATDASNVLSYSMQFVLIPWQPGIQQISIKYPYDLTPF